jgi:hypothetical protein
MRRINRKEPEQPQQAPLISPEEAKAADLKHDVLTVMRA